MGMAEALVLDLGFDPVSVSSMLPEQVAYWYGAAVKRERRRNQK